MTFTHALATNNYGTAKFIVSALAYQGTHTTIAAALTAASSGDTIFIRPGTYTENPTLKAGVNLAAYDCDALTPNVVINGKCTFTAAGTVSISGIQLQTNSDFCLAVTGSAASIVNLQNCFINALNNTAISYTSSSPSSIIVLNTCNGNIATTGITLFSNTGADKIALNYCQIGNSGNSTTASNTGTGANFNAAHTLLTIPISTSSTGTVVLGYTNINTSTTNTIPLTTAGTGTSNIEYCDFVGGTASAISIGTGTTIQLTGPCTANSTNTNAITGAGTLNYALITYTNTSSTNNVTTQVPYPSQPMGWTLLQTQTASNVASISFTSATITSAYKAYALVLQNVVPITNNVAFSAQVSINNGGAYLNTGYATSATNFAGGSTATVTSTTSWLIINTDISNTAADGLGGTLYMYNLTNGVTPSFTGNLMYKSVSAAATDNALTGGFAPAATTVNNIQFVFSSGNISTGTFSLYGIRQ